MPEPMLVEHMQAICEITASLCCEGDSQLKRVTKEDSSCSMLHLYVYIKHHAYTANYDAGNSQAI